MSITFEKRLNRARSSSSLGYITKFHLSKRRRLAGGWGTIKELGKVTPFGVFDIFNNLGFVNVGITHDTAEFAVESIKKWWYLMGKDAFPKANTIYITADSGGSNGVRVKLWKLELQSLADELGISFRVSHFPPGTSKWNKIEHRLFSFISKN
jgi:hypothetical protein